MLRRLLGGVAVASALVFGAMSISIASASSAGLEAYEVEIADGGDLSILTKHGFDVVEGRVGESLEIIATRGQAAELRKQGLDPRVKTVDGMTASEFATRDVHPDGSYDIYRPYFDDTCTATTCYVGRDGNGDPRQTLYQEMMELADENRDIVKPVVIGHSLDGAPILALRVTRDAREASNPDGSKPAVLYNAAQHAREWITPEMVRRLAHLFVDNYDGSGNAIGTDGQPVDGISSEELTRLVDTRELWFVVVANPDGYDFTFTPGNRLWRKNLRDNNGDGQITTGDGVDPNRNFPTYWNYDDEGSSSDPSDETYRGTGPASEPETQAMNGFLRRLGFEFMINYHSAAELLLYGHGFQVQTPSPDDALYEALSGTDVDPAIAGKGPGAPNPYDPDVSSELYTTNGETTEHAHSRHGTLAWTPEMDVADPARGGGSSVFTFQDSDADLQDAFEKNIPFALDVADSADDPANPESHLNRKAPDFEIHPFAVSYGDPQTVEVNAKRELGPLTVHWKINGGPTQSASTSEFGGGERYGENQNVYYHFVRGQVSGAVPGDDVKVWFEGGGERSQSFTYEVRSNTGNRVLVLAAEDYTGNSSSPAYPSTSGPFFDDYYTDALAANGLAADIYDVDAEGREAPDPLGVLSHYDAVVWYTGNDLLTRGPGQGPGTGVARLANDLILNVRDYLNEGGKLLYTGQYAATAQTLGFAFNVEGEPPFCPPGGDAREGACIPISDDFLQYWLGAYKFVDVAGAPFGGGDPGAVSDLDLFNVGDPFGATEFTLNGPASADNQEHVYSMLTTSSILPPAEYPLFDSREATAVDGPNPYDPATGSFYVVAESDDEGWQRLRKTIDLSGASSAELDFKISYDTEEVYDYLIVEAHTVGQDNWTTLPDQNGHTENDTGESCGIDWRSIHPFLDHYQDPATCDPTGTTGEWHGATGNSGGYQDWSIDLSAYAGEQVEISISYVQDFAVSGLGAFVDDVAVTEDGVVTDETSFEADLGGFTAGPPPPGSEAGTQAEWTRSESLGYSAGPGVATDDTLAYGFGFEGISEAAERNAVMADAMRYLGVLTPTPPPDNNGGGGGGGGGGSGGGSGGGDEDQADTKAPKTKLKAGPKRKTSSDRAKFKFRSNEPGSTFRCKLDRKRWKSCDSPQRYKNLDTGRHRFKVRATDKAGNTDKSPAKYRWRVT